MADFIQPSFSSGEISPEAFGRIDLAKYQTALKTCRNFLTRVHGGAVNRPGTEFIAESYPGRFIPFIFNADQAYILDFGDQIMRVIIQGGYVYNSQQDLYQIFTSYSLPILPKLVFTKLRDVMTLTVDGIGPLNLSRFAHDNWTFTAMEYKEGPFQDINTDTGKIIQTEFNWGQAIAVTTNFDVFVPENVGQGIYIEQRDYGQPWIVGEDVSIGAIRRSEGKYYKALNAAKTGTLRPSGEELTVQENDGAVVWEYIHSGYGVAIITDFVDSRLVHARVTNIFPDDVSTSGSYKWAFHEWGGNRGWPSVVFYFQGRRGLMSTSARPEGVWFSAVNDYSSFGKSTPIVDDDAVSMQLIGDRVDAARYAVQLGKLIILTAGSKWVIPDDDNNPVLTPSHRSARQQGALGIAQVPPVVVEDSIIYVVDKSQTVQDLSYQFVSNAYSGKDLSVLSKHLLEGHTIVASAYQHVPFQVYWLVRDDGVLISCTYLREQEVWGWHRHDTTNGQFVDVCVIPEAKEDAVYFKVRRTIDGSEKYYTERLASRLYTDIKNAWFVDSGLRYDGHNTTNLALSLVVLVSGFGMEEFGKTSGGFGGGGPISDVFSIRTNRISYFTQSHVGDEIHFPVGDRVLRFRITSILSPSEAAVYSARTIIPDELKNQAFTTNWIRAKSTLSGFNHLEGQIVNVLADGLVHPQVQVVDGSITLEYAAGVILAGLPIEADFETLNLNAPAPGSILDKLKCVFGVRLLVNASRGIFAGPDADHLDEYVQRENEAYDDPVSLKDGLVTVRVDSQWKPGGNVFVRQFDPLPLSILAVMPDVDIGGSL